MTRSRRRRRPRPRADPGPQWRDDVSQLVVAADDRLLGHLDHHLRKREVMAQLGAAPELEQRVGAHVEGEKLLRMDRRQPVPRLADRQTLEFEAEAHAVGVSEELLGQIEGLGESGQRLDTETRPIPEIDNGLEGDLDVLVLISS